MMRRFLPLLAACFVYTLVAGPAAAQDTPADSAVAVAPADVAAPTDEAAPTADAKTDEFSFPWFSIAPKVGFVSFGEGSFSAGGFTTTVAARSGARIALDLAMGGDGFAFELSPYYIHESGTGLTANTLGAYLGFLWRLQFGRWYPHFGAGMQAGYMLSDNIDLGLELYGRVPLGVTWYLLDNLGLVAELGIGYGATAVKGKSVPGAAAPELKFAPNVMVDFSVGIRWP